MQGEMRWHIASWCLRKKVGTTDKAMLAATRHGCAILEVPLLVALEVRIWKDF